MARFHCNLDAVDVEADLAILLVIGEARAEDDRGASHVEETLEKDETIEIGVFIPNLGRFITAIKMYLCVN